MQSSTTHGGAGAAPITAPNSGARNVNARDDHVDPGDIAVGVVVGRAAEYFEFFTYAIASAIVFPSIFFPWADRLDATLYSFAIFALAFIARPIGTVLFMAIQKRHSRDMKLGISLLMMGTATVVIAMLPSYNEIGMNAVFMLAGLRIAQGLAQGGSWDGLPSLLALSAPENKRGWYAMLGQLSAPIGFAIAAGVFAYLLTSLTQEDFLTWGWRYPFFVAFAINVVGTFARLRLASTPEYARLLDSNHMDPAPVGELVNKQGSNIAIGAMAALASYALFHLITVFPLSWIQLYDTRPVDEFLVMQMWGAGVAALAMLASGIVADKLGRRTTLGTAAALIALFSAAIPFLMDAGPAGQNAFILIGFALLGFSYGQAAGATTSNFQKHFRYTGAALTSDLAWLVGAAFAPLVALGLSAHFGLGYVSLYLLSGAVASLAALSLNRKLEIRD